LLSVHFGSSLPIGVISSEGCISLLSFATFGILAVRLYFWSSLHSACHRHLFWVCFFLFYFIYFLFYTTAVELLCCHPCTCLNIVVCSCYWKGVLVSSEFAFV
jgi:hypothetical protein